MICRIMLLSMICVTFMRPFNTGNLSRANFSGNNEAHSVSSGGFCRRCNAIIGRFVTSAARYVVSTGASALVQSR